MIVGGVYLKIPYVDLRINGALLDEIQSSISEVLQSGQYILGAAVKEFEDTVCRYLRTEYAFGVNSGLDALVLALQALNIANGDEVITVSNSFVATVAAIANVGAKPVLIDVADDRNVDPEMIELAITSRTKAIIPVHLAGRPAQMNEILAIAKKHGLFVIEDAAQAFGATLEGKQAGSFGDIGCFSLHPLKNLGACGDGGILVTSHAHIAEKVRLLRNHGLKNRDECTTWGWNSRLDSLQAAILNVKMRYLDEWNRRRQSIAAFYHNKFSQLPFVKPVDHPHSKSVYHAYVIETDQRDELYTYLNAAGVECKIHYPIQIHEQESFINSYGVISLPKTEQQGKKILSLPVNHCLSDAEVETVAEKVRNFFQ